ncbi:hypothetical protein PVK06_017120 [Gossypium arboreum]|uniref:Uncharacterized protein n=1 Tax=Gossypium arboreum TaxID=29729 RepID=A0ABR0Q2S8_GOSAR|nr:hypothetical protein PVK06_017120 [Gossypium arboreum]
MGYIGAHGIAALHKYKYSGEDHSYLARYVLQPFWSRLVNFFSLWMPAYACIVMLLSLKITLTGFMFLVISALLAYIYSPHCDSAPPRWVHFVHGLLLFIYQYLNIIKGSKNPQSYKIDSYLQLVIMAVGSTAICERDTFWFWCIALIHMLFFIFSMQLFHNTLILPVINGPTKGIALLYTWHIFTAIVGAQWWAQKFGKSIPFIGNVHKVIQAKKGSMLLALAMLHPFILLIGGVLVWDYLSPSDIIRNHPHLLILGAGLAFGFLVGRMILAHLCDEPKGLKTNMCMACRHSYSCQFTYKISKFGLKRGKCYFLMDLITWLKYKFHMFYFQPLLYLPLAIANALTARRNEGAPLVDEFWVVLGSLDKF